MACRYNHDATLAVKRLLKDRDEIFVWKGLFFADVYGDNGKVTKQLTSPMYTHIWKVGENVSNRTEPKKTRGEKSMQNGFHAYLVKGKTIYYSKLAVRFLAKREDFVGAGPDDQVVFSKLTLLQIDYDKVMKKPNRKARNKAA